jgi:predicted nucleic acid-binding protein
VELADTSAWTNRHRRPDVQADFEARLVAGDIATCAPVKLELLWTTQTNAEFDRFAALVAALPQIGIDPPVWERAIDVWRQLVARGRHRQVPQPDLVTAAAAEAAGVAVCHYDRHFDLIAEVTGQPVRAIAPLGTL